MDRWLKWPPPWRPHLYRTPFFTHLFHFSLFSFLETAMNVCFKEPCRTLPWENAAAWSSPSELSLSSVPAAVGLKFCADARHTGSLVTSFLVQTPVGAADMTLVEIKKPPISKRGKGGGGQFNSLTKSLLLLKRERTLKATSHIPSANSELCYLVSCYANPRDSDTKMWCILWIYMNISYIIFIWSSFCPVSNAIINWFVLCFCNDEQFRGESVQLGFCFCTCDNHGFAGYFPMVVCQMAFLNKHSQ